MLMKKESTFSFLFYDYETFGLNPIKDRIAQFACVRTNINFQIIEDPITLYCKLDSDYLPNPESILIHNISPKIINLNGKKEYKFANQINNIFSRSNTCILGYNNIEFDDEFSRYLFYRNFYDTYGWSWKNKNSRWDVLKLVRACYVLRPQGIHWPKINNIPIFNLEKIATINNIQPYYKSHDALSDVYTTIAVIKLIKNKQPLLYNFFFQNRKKNKIIKIINLFKIQIFIYISHIYKNANNNLSCITPLFWYSKNQNILVSFDLKNSVNDFISKIKNISLKNQKYILSYIKFINFSKSPLLVPINILRSEDIKRLKFKIEFYTKNFLVFKKHYLEIKNLIKYHLIDFYKSNYQTNIYNVDEQLYKNFFPNEDLIKFCLIHKKKVNQLNNLSFKDIRANILLFKYRARNFPFTLNSIEKDVWDMYLKHIFNKKVISNYINKINFLLQNHTNNNEQILILHNLLQYVKNQFFELIKV
ncbi:exodeoxyribonuclease I [Enterobacteriaceae endosymbiont of Donacia tomentosa]|uniref:exodeoxyribonuclease I n=1 Tax=Enterobacteriaceae endosymbiont of Donacia tomentosa TaxID=2675787 RepID=UPI00144914FA|nr:exodeoxyribonuclease I [Enterobacteriaceae endosymbiont of Donacia tomentosa]QJC31787.1 exodeoxyribonuclease I [Enterobacteriaceae endosymbiont of Donacia tomentosa]